MNKGLVVSSNGAQLAKAINDSKIIKTSSELDFEDTLRYVFLMIGIKTQNLPGDEETKILKNFIRNYFGNHTLSEIVLAFEMATTDKLVFEKGETANHYENFSCLYFSKIMNAYRKWASSEIKHLPKKEEVLELPPTEPKWEEVWDDYTKRSLNQDVEKMIIILPIYEWLVQSETLVLSPEEKWVNFELAQLLYYQELQENNNGQSREIMGRLSSENWIQDKDLAAVVQNRAKIICVRNLLRQIKNEAILGHKNDISDTIVPEAL